VSPHTSFSLSVEVDAVARECPTHVGNVRSTLKALWLTLGQTERGYFYKLIQIVPRDVEVLAIPEVLDPVESLGLAADGDLIEAVRGTLKYPAFRFSMSDILMRLADMVGETADWSSDVTVH